MLLDGSRGRVWNWIFRDFETAGENPKITRQANHARVHRTERSTANVSGVALVRSRHWTARNVKQGEGRVYAERTRALYQGEKWTAARWFEILSTVMSRGLLRTRHQRAKSSNQI